MRRSLNSLRIFRAFARLRRDESGISAVEFALVLPVMILLAAGLTEMGRVVNQATTVQKSLRAGAIYAVRNQFPLTAAVKTTAENLVKKGDPTGAAGYLVPG
jgi:Flp pilus assembly protein TadG